MPKNENEKNEPNTDETAAPAVATADLSILNEDQLMAYKFMEKAVSEAGRLSVGSESETDTLVRIFESASDDVTKGALLTLVAEARKDMPDAETVKAGLAKAKTRYDAGLIAWNSEKDGLPETFVIPTLPESVKKSGGSATGRGAGVPRPRGLRAATAEYGADTLKGEKDYLTCATLAQKIGDGVTTASLFDAWKSQAGDDSEAWTEGQTAEAEVQGTKNTHKVTFFYTKG